jgi:hypothetical protein
MHRRRPGRANPRHRRQRWHHRANRSPDRQRPRTSGLPHKKTQRTPQRLRGTRRAVTSRSQTPAPNGRRPHPISRNSTHEPLVAAAHHTHTLRVTPIRRTPTPAAICSHTRLRGESHPPPGSPCDASQGVDLGFGQERRRDSLLSSAPTGCVPGIAPLTPCPTDGIPRRRSGSPGSALGFASGSSGSPAARASRTFRATSASSDAFRYAAASRLTRCAQARAAASSSRSRPGRGTSPVTPRARAPSCATSSGLSEGERVAFLGGADADDHRLHLLERRDRFDALHPRDSKRG